MLLPKRGWGSLSSFRKTKVESRNANWGGRLGQYSWPPQSGSLFSKIVNYFRSIKSSWSKVVSTRRSSVLSLPLDLGFLGWTNFDGWHSRCVYVSEMLSQKRKGMRRLWPLGQRGSKRVWTIDFQPINATFLNLSIATFWTGGKTSRLWTGLFISKLDM